ncbi:MAG TPA: thiamine phosphate synthase [Candidatus Saccharimonadales bacterium]|nr:thiamine phosphate synthase [Candidatus Saccharimonadales bacterium]
MSTLGEARRERLARARLYLVTDARQTQGDLEAFLESVLAAGVDIVQLRQKDAEAGDLLRWSTVFRAAADRYGALFILNDRPDVAVAADADGVHVGQNDLPTRMVRRAVGEELIIGLSTHSTAEYEASPPDADYLCVGPLYATPTKPGRPATGVSIVEYAAARERDGSELRPWFAIGGISAATLPEVVEAGAARVAVVRAITESLVPASSVCRLIDALQGRPVS